VKTLVAGRSVRAEALARRGSIDDAVRFAREAVAIAEQTDALLDHGEARASLAAVFRAAKRDAEADAEAQRATELFQRKEATAKAPSRSAVAVAHLTPSDAPSPARTAHDRYVAAYNACDWTAMRAVLHDDFVVTDHRLLSLFAHTGADGWVRMLTTMFSSAPEQGRVARWVEAAPDVGMAELVQTGRVGDVAGGVEQRLLIVVASAGGRMTRAEVFDPSDEAAALAQMNELAQEK
jgi:hypothetical protein